MYAYLIFCMEDENAGDAGNLSSVLVVGVTSYPSTMAEIVDVEGDEKCRTDKLQFKSLIDA
jgi:hypothetical protein